MIWLVIAVLAFNAVLVVSMLRGGKLGERWYTGGQSRLDRDGRDRPADPTDNVRSRRR